VWENWFIVTLVTHSSGVSNSGVSKGIHHKCKHPLNPTKLYVSGWVESSRVLVYWFEGHNMLGWSVYIGLWKYIWLHDEIFLALAYHLLVWLPCMLFFYLCDDHQFIDGSRCERYSWSTGERWYRCIVYLGWTSRFIWAFL